MSVSILSTATMSCSGLCGKSVHVEFSPGQLRFPDGEDWTANFTYSGTLDSLDGIEVICPQCLNAWLSKREEPKT